MIARSARVIGRNAAAALLGLRARVLVRQHPGLGAARATALLSADLLRLLLAGALFTEPLGLELVRQEGARQITVEPLRTGLLTFHPRARRLVYQNHAGRDLVHV